LYINIKMKTKPTQLPSIQRKAIKIRNTATTIDTLSFISINCLNLKQKGE
jgi:hypothetical protein